MAITINQSKLTTDEIFTFGSNQSFKYLGSKGNDIYVITPNQSGSLTINDAKGTNAIIFQKDIAVQKISYNKTKNQLTVQTDQNTLYINNADSQVYTNLRYSLDKFLSIVNKGISNSSKGIYFFKLSTITTNKINAEANANDPISIKGSSTNDIFTLGSNHSISISDTKGNEHYYISQYQTGNVVISDKIGSNVIHLDKNLKFSKVIYNPTSQLLTLTLSNNRTINIESASQQTYTLNGQDTTLISGIENLVVKVTEQLVKPSDATGTGSGSASGNSSSSNSSTTPSTDTESLTGRIIDGAIANAFVFIDANSNNIYDFGEYFTKSDNEGYYTFANIPVNAKEGHFIAIGGTDIATGLPTTQILKASFGAKVITPMSTLIIAISEVQKISLEEAQTLLKAKLNLSAEAQKIDLLTYDPTAQSIENYKPTKDSAKVSIELQGLSIKLGNTMNHLTSIIKGSTPNGELSTNFLINQGLNDLAYQISNYANQINSTSLLDDPSFIEQLILSIANDSALNLSNRAKNIITKDVYSLDENGNTLSFLVRTLLKLNSRIETKLQDFYTNIENTTNTNTIIKAVLDVWNDLISLQAVGQNQLPLAVIHTIYEQLQNPNLSSQILNYLQPYLNDITVDGTTNAGLSLKIMSGNQDTLINITEKSQDLIIKLSIDNPEQLIEQSLVSFILNNKIISGFSYKITATDLANKSLTLTLPSSILSWGDDGSKVLKAQITLPNGTIGKFKPTLDLTLDTIAPTSPNITKLDGSIALNESDITTGFQAKIILPSDIHVGDSVSLYADDSVKPIVNIILTQADIANGFILKTFQAGEVKNAISAIMLDQAGNESAKSQLSLSSVSVVPKVPTLASGEDTGKSSTDNITNKYQNLKFIGNYPIVGSTINLIEKESNLLLGSTTITNAKGDWTISSSKILSDGNHNIIAQAIEPNKQPSNSSPTLITIDTIVPTPAVTKLDGTSIFIESDVLAGFKIKINNLPTDIYKVYIYSDDGVTQLDALSPTTNDISAGYLTTLIGSNKVTKNLYVAFTDIAGNISKKATMRLGDNPTGIDNIINLNNGELGEPTEYKGTTGKVDEFRVHFNSNENGDTTIGDFIIQREAYDVINFGAEDRLHFYDDSKGKRIETLSELESYVNVANDFKDVELSFAGSQTNAGLIINLVGVATSYYSTLDGLETAINPLTTNLYLN